MTQNTQDPSLPVVIADVDYPAFVRERTNAAYEKFVVPGAYFDHRKKRLYTSRSEFIKAFVKRKRKSRKLMKHEKGHEWGVPLDSHPTDTKGLRRHARQVRYDDRAGTWLLRLRWFKPTLTRFKEWEKMVLDAWLDNRIRIYTKVEAEMSGL